MKNLLIICILGSFLMMKPEYGKGSHMFGSDLTWTCVGKDSFVVKLVVYRDCNGVSLSAASIPIRCSTTGQTITNVTISLPSPVDISPTCGSSCTRCQSSSCSFPYGIEQYTFSKLVVLNGAGSCCKVTMSYTVCCRNGTITTGAANANYFIDASLDRCLTPCDNSPRFTNPPAAIICVGQDFQFNSGVIDVDIDSNGVLLDSISCEWTQPLSASGSTIAYSGSYAYDKPLYFWGFPNTKLPYPRGLQLNPLTGQISFRPMKVEQTVMALKVGEWRKISGIMTKIGEVRRDIQIIIISCPNNTAPVLSSTYYKEVCAGDTVTFNINTTDINYADTLTISWNKAIKNAIWSDNNGKVLHPTATLTWCPDTTMVSSTPYLFTVTAHDNGCPINSSSSKTFQILVKPASSKSAVNFSVIDTGCGIYYFALKNPVSGVSYEWKGFSPAEYKIRNTSFIHAFKKTGTYPISVTGSQNGCVKYYSIDSFEVKKNNLMVRLPVDRVVNPGTSTSITPSFSNVSGNIKFKWFNGDTASNPLVLYPLWKDVAVSITAEDSLKCPVSDTMFIDVKILSVDIGKDQSVCPGKTVTFLSKVEPGINTNSVTYAWFLKGDTVSKGSGSGFNVSYPGTYICKVTDNNGETATDEVKLINFTLPKVTAGDDTALCNAHGLYQLKGQPSSLLNTWNGTAVIKSGNDYYFDPQNSTIKDGNSFNLSFQHIDSNGCIQNDYKRITVIFTPPKPFAGVYPDLCLYPINIQLTPSPKNGTWYGKGINSAGTYFSPSVVGEGKHMLIYAVNNYNCVNSDTTYITVFDTVEPVINTVDYQSAYCVGNRQVELKSYPPKGIWTGPVGSIVNGHYFNTQQKTDSYILNFEYIDSNKCHYNKALILKLLERSIDIDKKDLLICENEILYLFAQTNFNNNIKWTKGATSDGVFLNNDNNSIINYKPGINDLLNKSFWLNVTTTDSICNNKKDSALIIINTIETEFDYLPGTITSVPLGVSFTDVSTTYLSTINSWNWDFSNGQTSILQNPYIIFDSFGKYFIQLKVKNSQNCLDSLTKELNIVSSIEDEISSSLFIIPNPASEQVLIKSAGSNIEFLRLINGMGQIVKSEQNIDNEQYLLINNKGLKGIYLLQTGIQNGKIKNSKIMFE